MRRGTRPPIPDRHSAGFLPAETSRTSRCLRRRSMPPGWPVGRGEQMSGGGESGGDEIPLVETLSAMLASHGGERWPMAGQQPDSSSLGTTRSAVGRIRRLSPTARLRVVGAGGQAPLRGHHRSGYQLPVGWLGASALPGAGSYRAGLWTLLLGDAWCNSDRGQRGGTGGAADVVGAGNARVWRAARHPRHPGRHPADWSNAVPVQERWRLGHMSLGMP